MTTYRTILFVSNGSSRTIDRGLTLEEAQQICSDDDSSSETCCDKQKLASYGSGPWFIGYTEE